MLFLALAVTCSVAIGMIFKVAGREQMDRTALLTVNYLAAVGVAGVLLGLGGRATADGLTLSPSLLGLGVFTGALLIAGFFLLSVATDVAGMSLAIGVMRVSVVIPFTASWIIWNEVPTVAQTVGLVLAGAAFFLIAQKQKTPEPVPAAQAAVGSEASLTDALPEPTPPSEWDVGWRAFAVLGLTFLSGGAVDVTMKTFEEVFGAANSRVLFLLLAFGIAFLIGAAIVVVRGVRTGTWPKGQTIAWGIGLGIINYGSLEFLLRAIEVLPGTVVFPANNIAIVLVAAFLGVTVWNEHLSRTNRFGLGLAVVALVLLGL